MPHTASRCQPTRALAFTAFCMLGGCAALDTADAPRAGALHVPSPDWRDQIIYFAMIDRFDDGDATNNDQGAGEYDPADGAKYSGGDLAGLTRRIDYIRELGATTLWITPPVRHRWWDPMSRYGGYHGYWGEHFMQVDPHFGSLDDYRALSRALHGAGMYLVQDIVVNHTGNYFAYPETWDAARPEIGFALNPDHRGNTAPTQKPFMLNDARRADHRAAGIYHFTPTITDYSDRRQELERQLADLDDLNTEHPDVRDALRQSYGYWIDRVGVDGYRVDTAFYVPEEYFDDFLHHDGGGAPGILRVAKRSGRDAFHVFGEGFGIDAPYADAQARKIERYLRDDRGPALLPGMINFPLYGGIGDVVARGRPTAVLGHRIRSMMALHAEPRLMPTFVDNHDVDRFLRGGSEAALKQALLLTMTLPGIPTIYYGTEQGFVEQRGAMFAHGFASGGRDRFDQDAPLYRYLRTLTSLRRAHPALSRGTPEVLHENAASAGALVYRMRDGDTQLLIALNTADREVLIDNLDLGTPAVGLTSVFGIDAQTADVVTDADGRAQIRMPARGGAVWRVADAAAASTSVVAAPVMTALADAVHETDFDVGGSARPGTKLRLVFDGDLGRAAEVIADADGRWQARVATGDMIDPDVEHRVVAWDDSAAQASARATFRVAKRWTLLATQADPAGDDRGPAGRYLHPDDALWAQRPMDIRGLRLYGADSALRVAVDMNAIVAGWNPANGFDHVAFTLSFSLPDRDDGSALLPLQNATLPEGQRWQYRVRAHGWSNALFAADGASATSEGSARTPVADIAVDRAAGVVVFTLPASALGDPATLSGLRVHVNTWDYDGGYKPLRIDVGGGGFGGGDGRVDPLIMDSAVVTVP